MKEEKNPTHRLGLPGNSVGPDSEIEEMARKYSAYIKIKAMSCSDVYKYLTFEQYIKLFSPRVSRDWAYIDNRTSNLQRRKNGH